MPAEKYTSVPDLLDDLDMDKREQVNLLRNIILNLEFDLTEHIKWNAPSFILNGEDRITFNLVNKENVVKLVIHMGAVRKEDKKAKPILSDDGGVVQWSSDIRGAITFNNLEDLQSKSSTLKKVLSDWLAISHL